ncbi:MAG: hypothetical protein D6715_06665 [Calditrichaeota bacterium]|nr:MAG: hypothetical protein D6715_06665 [Calditrichota bacterium]
MSSDQRICNYLAQHKNAEENSIFLELCEVFRRLGVTVRLERGDFRSGLCRVHGGELILLLNRKQSPAELNAAMLAALNSLDHEAIYLTPRIREQMS